MGANAVPRCRWEQTEGLCLAALGQDAGTLKGCVVLAIESGHWPRNKERQRKIVHALLWQVIRSPLGLGRDVLKSLTGLTEKLECPPRDAWTILRDERRRICATDGPRRSVEIGVERTGQSFAKTALLREQRLYLVAQGHGHACAAGTADARQTLCGCSRSQRAVKAGRVKGLIACL